MTRLSNPPPPLVGGGRGEGSATVRALGHPSPNPSLKGRGMFLPSRHTPFAEPIQTGGTA